MGPKFIIRKYTLQSRHFISSGLRYPLLRPMYETLNICTSKESFYMQLFPRRATYVIFPVHSCIASLKRPNGQMFRLLKSLCGLKQVAKLWYAVLSKTIRRFIFYQPANFDCLFVLPRRDPVYIVAYVYDFIVV